MTTPLGAFGAPPDGVAWCAVAAALALALFGFHGRRVASMRWPSDSVWVGVLAAAAALLSSGYVAYYLHGGPRIIDATSYFLQARALSEGHVAMPLGADAIPSASFRGRFLLSSADGRALSVIFPPGYPALLALGFLAHAPMAVGPALAAALVVATHALARRSFDDPRVARLAAVLSVLCGTLRYHTADTISHGLAALLLATALWAALGDGRRSSALAGMSAGLLLATRPVSGLLCFVLVVFAVRRKARLFEVFAGAVPAALLLLLEQRAATGAWFTSSQAAYYALADAPSRCFRYGFGSGIGCRFEHGDFVRAHLRTGFGVLASLGTTLRRLKMHAADVANTELFAVALVYAVVRAFRERTGRPLAIGVVGIVFAYAPFYFDGNYPAGGARFFADVLPLEHVLVAWALVGLGFDWLAAPVALLGFAFHTSYDHEQLAHRDGGRPMFEPALLERPRLGRAIVFVSTDHGFNLGFDPKSLERAAGVVVARRRNDAHDARLWEALGRPAAYDYVFDPSGAPAKPSLIPIVFDATDTERFEAEAEWPPLVVRDGSVEPVFPACASRGRALWIVPSASGAIAFVRFEVPSGARRTRGVRLGWVGRNGVSAAASVKLGRAEWRFETQGKECGVAPGPTGVHGEREFLEVTTESELGIDFVELGPGRPP